MKTIYLANIQCIILRSSFSAATTIVLLDCLPTYFWEITVSLHLSSSILQTPCCIVSVPTYTWFDSVTGSDCFNTFLFFLSYLLEFLLKPMPKVSSLLSQLNQLIDLILKFLPLSIFSFAKSFFSVKCKVTVILFGTKRAFCLFRNFA